jgi:hypothetical protein
MRMQAQEVSDVLADIDKGIAEINGLTTKIRNATAAVRHLQRMGQPVPPPPADLVASMADVGQMLTLAAQMQLQSDATGLPRRVAKRLAELDLAIAGLGRAARDAGDVAAIAGLIH